MTEFFTHLKWQFVIFRRNNLLAMIVAITAFYVAAIYLLMGIGDIEKFVTLLILNDPSMIGFMFIGLSIILDKDQEVLAALFVAPINYHFYLLSRIAVLTVMCLFCAFAMVLVAKGLDFNPVHFAVGVASTCVLFSLIGIYVVSYTTDVLHFILRSVPLLILFSLPILNYFELTDLMILRLLPTQGCIYLLANSYSQSTSTFEIVIGYVSIAVWLPLLYWFVSRTFRTRMVKA